MNAIQVSQATGIPVRHIHLNSRDATRMGTATWKFHFSPFVVPKDTNIELALVDGVIPCSWYVINSSNNKVLISGLLYEIEPGTYNALELRDALNNLLPVNVSYSRIKNAFTLTSGISFSLGANEILGFSEDRQGTSLTSDTAVNLSGTQSIHIKIMNISNKSISTHNRKHSRTIARVPTWGERNTHIYVGRHGNREVIHQTHLGLLEIQFVDDRHQEIDFRGAHWELSFEASCSLKIDTPTEMTHREISQQLVDGNQGNTKPQRANTSSTNSAV